MKSPIALPAICLALLLLLSPSYAETPENFQRENLIAWCIVPFDAKQRGPEARTEMLVDLGLKRVAYDWRQEHVAEFATEFQQYQAHDIELFAFWRDHPSVYPLFTEYELQPQIWSTVPSPAAETQEAKVKQAADKLMGIAQNAQKAGLKFGLYNHGNWGGQPTNMIAVCEEMRQRGLENVGIVYNFHHAHFDRAEFLEHFDTLKPYLHCLNLNGMKDPDKVDVKDIHNKICPIGSGEHEQAMIAKVLESGYTGPIGILGHLKDRDVKVVLEENLAGLEKVLADLQ